MWILTTKWDVTEKFLVNIIQFHKEYWSPKFRNLLSKCEFSHFEEGLLRKPQFGTLVDVLKIYLTTSSIYRESLMAAALGLSNPGLALLLVPQCGCI